MIQRHSARSNASTATVKTKTKNVTTAHWKKRKIIQIIRKTRRLWNTELCNNHVYPMWPGFCAYKRHATHLLGQGCIKCEQWTSTRMRTTARNHQPNMRVANIIEDVDLIDLFSHFIPFSFIILAIRFTLEFECCVFGFSFRCRFGHFVLSFLLTLYLHAMQWNEMQCIMLIFILLFLHFKHAFKTMIFHLTLILSLCSLVFFFLHETFLHQQFHVKYNYSHLSRSELFHFDWFFFVRWLILHSLHDNRWYIDFGL